MKDYYVYTNEPESLKDFGQVYHPKIKMSYVLFSTELELTEIWCLPGVYEARECEKGSI